jgi:hypothetical protein
MAGNEKIVYLRNLLTERFGVTARPLAGQILTGISSLDETGALQKGTITELLSSRASAGSALLIHSLLAYACQHRCFLALIDGSDSFDPQSACGNALNFLFWIRCEHATRAMQAADLVVRDGNFPIVILDLILNPAEELRRIPSSNWYRLQRLVEPAPAALLVLTRYSIVASASTKIVLSNWWSLLDLERNDTVARLRLRVCRSRSSRSVTV